MQPPGRARSFRGTSVNVRPTTVRRAELNRSRTSRARRPTARRQDADDPHRGATPIIPSATDPVHDDEAVIEHLGLARTLARRFRGRGPEPEDLEQVAYLGLVKAVRGFDADRGSLAAYATATILGELKRHFRDGGWMVRPPRPVQELQLAIRHAVDEHIQRCGAPPGDAELARTVGQDIRDVREARAAVGCFAPQSIDESPGPDARPMSEDLPADDDGAFDRVEELASLTPLGSRLDDADRALLRMRFFEERTQQDIADVLGISQMQVSRRLSRVLASLRLAAGTPATAPRRGTAPPSPTGRVATTQRTRAA